MHYSNGRKIIYDLAWNVSNYILIITSMQLFHSVLQIPQSNSALLSKAKQASLTYNQSSTFKEENTCH